MIQTIIRLLFCSIPDTTSITLEKTSSTLEKISTILEKTSTIFEIASTIFEIASTTFEKSSTILEKSPTILEKSPTILKKSPIILKKNSTTSERLWQHRVVVLTSLLRGAKQKPYDCLNHTALLFLRTASLCMMPSYSVLSELCV